MHRCTVSGNYTVSVYVRTYARCHGCFVQIYILTDREARSLKIIHAFCHIIQYYTRLKCGKYIYNKINIFIYIFIIYVFLLIVIYYIKLKYLFINSDILHKKYRKNCILYLDIFIKIFILILNRFFIDLKSVPFSTKIHIYSHPRIYNYTISIYNYICLYVL